MIRPEKSFRNKFHIRRIAALLLCLLMTMFFLPAVPAHAEENEPAEKVVRVGWYESPLNTTDASGRRSGYAYEYQRKIAAYTGWKYEYVEGNWPDLLKMLENGELDLMSDISYTPQRAMKILYPTLPMGTETYYIYAALTNKDISRDDPSTLNGKKIGVTRDSVQAGIFKDWAKQNKLKVETVELGGSEDDSLNLLLKGEIDALVTLEAYGDPQTLIPVSQVGSTDFYFAVNKSRPDLLADLNSAMGKIRDEDNHYNHELYEKYLQRSNTNQYLSAGEKAWLSSHGKIRVGYQDNYLSFCARDSKTGELTGALKDVLNYASTCMKNANPEFEAVCYSTSGEAIEALQKGEIDCMFPSNLTDYDGESRGIVLSPALMQSDMVAVVREDDQKSFVKKEIVTVAVNDGNPNYEMFLEEHFPKWKTVHYTDTPTCLEHVAAGDADCILVSAYRYSNIAKQCEKLKLTTVSTGVDMDYCFAVREGNTELYSILAKITKVIPESTVNSALTYYSTEDAKLSFFDYIKEHLVLALTIVTLVLLIIVFLLLRNIRAEKKAYEEQQQIDDLSKRVNYDALTSVRNKGAFTNYIKMLQERIDNGEEFEFAVGILDCNNLKTINDKYGHEKGDEYLKASCRLICTTFRHSAVFRIGGDEFAVVMMNEDFQNREDLITKFETAQDELAQNSGKRWEKVCVANGFAVYDPATDRKTANITVRRADKIMYENKRIWKEEHKKSR